jgi:hypothetical protein
MSGENMILYSASSSNSTYQASSPPQDRYQATASQPSGNGSEYVYYTTANSNYPNLESQFYQNSSYNGSGTFELTDSTPSSSSSSSTTSAAAAAAAAAAVAYFHTS